MTGHLTTFHFFMYIIMALLSILYTTFPTSHCSVPVAVASCSVLALAASVECDQRHSAKVFKDAALTQLWKMAFSKVRMIL